MKRKIILLALVILMSVSSFKIASTEVENIEKAGTAADLVDENSALLNNINEYWLENQELYTLEFDQTLEECKPVQTYSPQRQNVLSRNPEISSLAGDITKDGKGELDKVYLLHEFVNEKLEYVVYEDWRDANEILATMDGDCTDKSIFMVSMLKSLNIESYVLYGNQNKGEKHAWVLARIDNLWLQVDPTSSSFYSVYECLENGCEYKNSYEPIAGLFNDDVSLKCSS